MQTVLVDAEISEKDYPHIKDADCSGNHTLLDLSEKEFLELKVEKPESLVKVCQIINGRLGRPLRIKAAHIQLASYLW